MPSSYPSSNDTFTEPSSPATTPLSQAGSGSRNHTQHHIDLGDAIEAIEANATTSTHDHSATGLNGPKLVQANTHQSPDTDSAPTALHHTLGTTANQSAAGNHGHSNYVDLSSTQTVTGKKTFPVGSNGIVIPDFTNSIHNHSSPSSGGIAAPPSWINTFAQGTSANGSVDVFPITQYFQLQTKYGTNFGLKGSIVVNYDALSTSAAVGQILTLSAGVGYNTTNTTSWNEGRNITMAPMGEAGAPNYVQLSTMMVPSTTIPTRGTFTVTFFLYNSLDAIMLFRILNTSTGGITTKWSATTIDLQLYPSAYANGPQYW